MGQAQTVTKLNAKKPKETAKDRVAAKSDDQLWSAVQKAIKEHAASKEELEHAEAAFDEAQRKERKAYSAKLRAQKEMNMRLRGEA